MEPEDYVVLPSDPQVFVVDNGLAFGDLVSNRGFEWRDIRVKRLPHQTVERLRNITEEVLETKLGIVAQFKFVDGQLVTTTPGQNLNKKQGVRNKDGILQLD